MEYGWFSQGELTEKGLVFTLKFHLRSLAIHARTVEIGWCLCNVIITQVKIEGIFQMDFELQEPKKRAFSGLQHEVCEFYNGIAIGYIIVPIFYRYRWRHELWTWCRRDCHKNVLTKSRDSSINHIISNHITLYSNIIHQNKSKHNMILRTWSKGHKDLRQSCP